ncbi:MAG TPA: hypothetical protein VGB77_15650 [Abditibacteriaceae bacterium]|jgi:hypothetical protein
MAKTVTIRKSAVTGRIVSKKTAQNNPKTTYTTKVKVGPVKKK